MITFLIFILLVFPMLLLLGALIYILRTLHKEQKENKLDAESKRMMVERELQKEKEFDIISD